MINQSGRQCTSVKIILPTQLVPLCFVFLKWQLVITNKTGLIMMAIYHGVVLLAFPSRPDTFDDDEEGGMRRPRMASKGDDTIRETL